MPLLFWASEVTGDPKYREKATAHILTAMNCVIRPDHSTYHTYFFDPETGEPVKGVTHQATATVPHGAEDRPGEFTAVL